MHCMAHDSVLGTGPRRKDVPIVTNDNKLLSEVVKCVTCLVYVHFGGVICIARFVTRLKYAVLRLPQCQQRCSNPDETRIVTCSLINESYE